jgi:hypothetical protein
MDVMRLHGVHNVKMDIGIGLELVRRIGFDNYFMKLILL